MSLRWRILASIVVVIVLTVVITVGVGYYTTEARLGVFVDQIGDDEATQLARNLSREYTAAGGWETVDRPLSEAGYIYAERPRGERSDDGDEGHFELLHQDPVRVVIAGLDGRVVKDNLFQLPPGAVAPELDGHRETVFDLSTDQPVGHVYVDVNHELLSGESHGFLNTLLAITLIAALLTAGLATLLAAWLSKRITAPVLALTEATQAIAQGAATELPVSSSDELGRMSAAFNRMTSTLESQRDLRKRLINDLSHELNTPLSVIQLEAKGLRDGLQTPENASDHIIQEVGRLRGLVTDLNWLAETDHGELRLSLQRSSVDELLAAELDRWRPQCQAQAIELSLQVSPDLPSIELDRMRMSQALGNIVSNAIHATEAGGNIELRAELSSNEQLAISITDDGVGIHAADLPRVFDRFYRTDESHARATGRTGLGLAIARAIVEAHGGTVAAASAGPGQGATVTIHLPVPSRRSPNSFAIQKPYHRRFRAKSAPPEAASVDRQNPPTLQNSNHQKRPDAEPAPRVVSKDLHHRSSPQQIPPISPARSNSPADQRAPIPPKTHRMPQVRSGMKAVSPQLSPRHLPNNCSHHSPSWPTSLHDNRHPSFW